MNEEQNNMSNDYPPSHLLYSRVCAKMGGDVADEHNLTLSDHGTVVDVCGRDITILLDRSLYELKGGGNKVTVQYGKDGEFFYDNFDDDGLSLRFMGWDWWQQNLDWYSYRSEWLFPIDMGLTPVNLVIHKQPVAPFASEINALVFNYSNLEWHHVVSVPSMLSQTVIPDDRDDISRDTFWRDELEILRKVSYMMLCNQKD